jgi:type IV pilus assembly protein PilC
MTQALLSVASFLESTFSLQIILLLAFVGLIRWLWMSPNGQAQGEKWLLRIPKLGNLYRMYHSSVFCRTLGVLLSGGLPVVQSLSIVAQTCPSPKLQERLALITEEVRSGAPLHQSIVSSEVVDPLAAEMIRVGESSSSLPEMLDHVADFFDQEIEKATVAFTNLIGPVLIVFMGIVVLGLLLAVYVPLFNASNVIR